MSTLAMIGLGSNLGDRRVHLDRAVADLAAIPGSDLRGVSLFHETAPVGGPSGQGAYLNAAAVLETNLEPRELLGHLQDIEWRAGRVRTLRWGERPLDLDLLLFGDQVIETPELTVPHPRMAVRRFVLAPLAQVAPKAVDPLTGRSVSSLLANLDRRPSYVALSGLAPAVAGNLVRRLVEGVSAIEVSQPETLEWTPKRTGDRWLVSDSWVDADFTGPLPSLVEDRARRLSPTFVVAGPGGRRTFSHGSPRWQGAPELGDVPILEVDPDRPGSIVAEVMAACEATRSAR